MRKKFKKIILFFVLLYILIYFYNIHTSLIFKLEHYYRFNEISKISSIGPFGDGYLIKKFSFKNENDFIKLKQRLNIVSIDYNDFYLYNLLDKKFSYDYNTKHTTEEIKKISNCFYLFKNNTPKHINKQYIKNFEIFIFDLNKKQLIYIKYNS